MSSLHPLDVQVAHSVTEVGQAAWDCLGGGRPFASYRWYRFGERALADVLPIYIILSRKGEPVARATFWLARQEPLPVSSRPVRRFIDALIRRWPLLICRAPLTSVSGLVLPETPLRDTALRTIAQVAQDQARQHRASFVIFDYLPGLETGWPETFSSVKLSEPGTCLPIAWPDLTSYLKHLSKSTQRDYRRKCGRAADLGLQVTSHQAVTVNGEVMALIRNVERHHHTAPNPWVQAILENAGMVDATWLTATLEDRLVGCGVVLSDANAGVATLLGLDYQVQYIYFQVLYAAIRCAIEKGLQALRGGSGAYEIKQRMGFQLEDNNRVAFAANNRTMQWLGRWMSASKS